MPILNREYNEAMRNLSSAEAKALALPLCTEVTKLLWNNPFNQNFSKLFIMIRRKLTFVSKFKQQAVSLYTLNSIKVSYDFRV